MINMLGFTPKIDSPLPFWRGGGGEVTGANTQVYHYTLHINFSIPQLKSIIFALIYILLLKEKK